MGGVAFSETPTYIVVGTVRSRGAFPPQPSRFSHLTIPISGHESLWTFLPRRDAHTIAYPQHSASADGIVAGVSRTTKTLLEKIRVNSPLRRFPTRTIYDS